MISIIKQNNSERKKNKIKRREKNIHMNKRVK